MQSSAASSAATTTAAIHEFVCLFTHDLVRKQKRWQDGRLKYHTHNNRIVVHDDRGNSVGDHHWVSDYAFDEGEEFRLDRGSVIVQVNECVGTRFQDLSELVDKRAKEREERRSAALSKQPVMPRPPASGLPTPNRSLHQASTFKPLQQVVGTPTGYHGRALIPTESPFEQRQKQAPAANDDSSPPAKRRRQAPSPPSKKGYAQSLFGATLSLSSQPQSSAPLRVRHVNTSVVRQEPPPTFPSSPAVEPEKPTHDFREQSQHSRAPLKPIATGSMSAQARGALPSLLSSRPQEMLVSKARKKTQPRRLLMAQENEEDIPVEQPKKAKDTYSGRRLIDVHETLDRDLTRNKRSNDASPADEVIEIQSSNESHPQPVTISHKSKKRERRSKPETSLVQGDGFVEIQPEDESCLQHVPHSHKAKKCEKNQKPATIPTKGDVRRDPDDGVAEKPQPRQQGTTSQVLQEPSPPAPVMEDDQPRTELRIKPRKKRGLLMLSGESGTTSKTAKAKETGPCEDIVRVLEQQTDQSSAHKPNPPPGRATVAKKRQNARQSKSTPFLQSEDDEQTVISKDVDTTAHGKSRKASGKPSASTGKRDRKAARSTAEVEADPGELSASREVPGNKRRKKAAQKSTKIEAGPGSVSDAEKPSFDLLNTMDADAQLPSESASATESFKSMSGPRLARFARKDIRSKEIVGFDFEDEDNVSNFNSFTAASLGIHVVEPAAVDVSAPETSCAEVVELPSSAEGNDRIETTDLSAMLPATDERSHETINVSSPTTEPSEGVRDQQAAASPVTESTMEKMGLVVKENEEIPSQSEEIDASSNEKTSAGQYKGVEDGRTGSGTVNAATRRFEALSDSAAQSVVGQNAAPSLCEKSNSELLAMQAHGHENPIIPTGNEREEEADEGTTEVDTRSQDNQGDIEPSCGKDEGSISETKALLSMKATNSNPLLGNASVDIKCLSATTRAHDADAKTHSTQDEDIAVASHSDGVGRMGNEGAKMSIQPVQEQVTLPTVVDQQPNPNPIGNTGRSNGEVEDTKSPSLSSAPRPRTRIFSRAKSMSMADAGTKKTPKPFLSRQSSAAAKITIDDAKPLPIPAETRTTSNTPPLSRAVPAAIQDAVEDKPAIATARLANPATRGRKAAKPSDAAGQAPQCPLPPETQMSTISGLGRLRGANAKPFKSPATVLVSRATPALGPTPAFTTASGDPWSREAFDLLDFQRPS